MTGLAARRELTGRWDLRLVGAALGCWLTALVGLRLSATAGWLVAGVAVLAALILGRRAAAGMVWASVAAAVLLGVACGAAATGARVVARDAPEVRAPVQQRALVVAELTLRRDPHRLDRPAAGPPVWLVPAWLHRLAPADRDRAQESPGEAEQQTRLRARVLVFAHDPMWQDLLPGQRIRVTGRLGPPRGGDLTAAVLSVRGPVELLGEPSWIQQVAGTVRAGLRRAAAPLPDRPGGLLPGLAVGDDSRLDPGLAADFTATGMTHLLAVSGSNVAIVVGFVVLLARALRAPPWATTVVSGIVLVGYVIVCRADASVIRAGVMGAVALVALAAGRPRAAAPALATTVFLLVIADPDLAAHAGFAMSVLATGALLWLAPRWRDGLRRRRVPPGVSEALAVPAAAQIAVAPVLAGLSGSISVVAVAANLLATPAVAPATVLGVAAAAVSPLWPTGAAFLAWLGSWPAWWLVLVAEHGARLPGAVVPWPAGVGGALLLAGLTLAGLGLARHRRLRVLAAVVVGAAALGVVPVRVLAVDWPPAGAVVVACAVGQGDLMVVPVAAGSGVVIDAGPDPVAADRCLRDLGIRTVPLLVITHLHADHVAGVDGVLRGRRVGAVLISPWPEPADSYAPLRTVVANGQPPLWPAQAGATYHVADEVTLTVLGPLAPLTGTRSDPNNNSVVLLATVRGVRVLLTGDAEEELQRTLLATHGPALRAEVLKVPHHGSAYQDHQFLAAVDPLISLIPVGQDNGYGHPDPALLAHLAAEGRRVWRTDLDGDVAVVRLADGRLAVVTRPPPPGARR